MARPRKPGRGTVLERQNKAGMVFQIRWRVNGGPARYETIGPDREKAEQALAVRLAQINAGTYRERCNIKLVRFASDWFAERRGRLKPSTVEDYRIALECHLLPFFGDYMLDQITPELIESYVAEKVGERQAGDRRVVALETELAKRKGAGLSTNKVEQRLYAAKRDRGLSNRSINKTLTRLRQVIGSAENRGYVDRNPVDCVERLKVPKKVRPYLQLDQVEPLLEATDETNRPLVGVLVLAGLRIGEALALRWGDVDLLGDPPRMTVRRTLYGKHEGPVKTGEEGTVAFGPTLLEMLLDHKESSAFTGDDQLVFCTDEGHHLNPSNVRQRVIAPAVEVANAKLAEQDGPLIPAVTPHGLRYTFASLLVAQGEDLATVAAQMRHADTTTTLRIYTQVMEHSRRGVAERLDAAIAMGRFRVASESRKDDLETMESSGA